MADSKITALTSISTSTDPAVDPLVIVDVSDTSMAATGTTKKVTLNNLLSSSPTATGNFTITGDLTVDTSTLKVDSTNNRVIVGHTSGSSAFQVSNAGAAGLEIQPTGVNSAPVILSYNRSGSAYTQLTLDGSTIVHALSGTTAMTLNSTGLGVGGIVTGTGPTILVEGTAGTYAKFNSKVGAKTWSAGYRSGTTQFEIQEDGTERFVIANGGNVGIGVTPAGTGGCLQLKSGITFPATQVASSDANTLDDYEEGTWTGTLTGGTTDPTIAVTATGRYTKVGRVVTVQISFSNVTTTGASGQIKVTGLPFTNNGTAPSCGSVLLYSIGTFTGSPVANVGINESFVALYSSITNAAFAEVTHNAGVTRFLTTSITYTV